MEFHEAANLFPPMSPDEFSALKACQELGIKPKTREWDSDGSLTLFVVSLNLHRRSLTPAESKTCTRRLRGG